MLKAIKGKLFLRKAELLAQQAYTEGKIVPIEEEFMDELKKRFWVGMSVYMHIKYFIPISPFQTGRCWDRTRLMLMCHPNATRAIGNVKTLEYSAKGDKNLAGHSWLEIGDYVYDPTTLMRYEKELYYQIHKPYDVIYETQEEFLASNKTNAMMKTVVTSSIDEYMPGGEKRWELEMSLPILKTAALNHSDPSLMEEVDSFIETTGYYPPEDSVYNKPPYQKLPRNKAVQ